MFVNCSELFGPEGLQKWETPVAVVVVSESFLRSCLCRIKEMVEVINYSLWAVFVLKAQHEFPERSLLHNHSYAPILLGPEMELCLNAWNLFLVLFLITTLFLFLWRSLGEGLERRGKGRKEAGKCVTDSRLFFFNVSELLAVCKVKGFNGSCRDANFIPRKLEPRRHVTNTMKT